MLWILRTGPSKKKLGYAEKSFWYIFDDRIGKYLCTDGTMQESSIAIGRATEITSKLMKIKFWSRKARAQKGLERYLKSLPKEQFAEYVAERMKGRSAING